MNKVGKEYSPTSSELGIRGKISYGTRLRDQLLTQSAPCWTWDGYLKVLPGGLIVKGTLHGN